MEGKEMSRYIDIDDLPTGRVEWDDIFDAPSIHRIWKVENGFCDSGDRKEGE